MGADPEYTTGFQFGLPEGDQRDPAESVVTDAMTEGVKETVEGLAEAKGE